MEDPTTADEPRGTEPQALIRQAAAAIDGLADAGLLTAGGSVAEYGSPHGGSWLPMLSRRGLVPVEHGERADLVVDCFGLMHEADQAAAIAERADSLNENGVLLIQYHSLASMVRNGQWNVLRHGHFAYYSTPALTSILTEVGLIPRTVWCFDLYGGTVLLAASRTGTPDAAVAMVMAEEIGTGVLDAGVVGGLQLAVHNGTKALRSLLETPRRGTVFGYGAASRAVALLCHAGVDTQLLSAVADASSAKWGRRMPGTSIPVISPTALVEADPAAVVLFVPDLFKEVKEALPDLADRLLVVEPAPEPIGLPRNVEETR